MKYIAHSSPSTLVVAPMRRRPAMVFTSADSIAKRGEFRGEPRDCRQGGRRGDRADPGKVGRNLARRIAAVERGEDAGDVHARRAVLVAGAVCADDDVLSHVALLLLLRESHRRARRIIKRKASSPSGVVGAPPVSVLWRSMPASSGKPSS